jgi:poly(A) polymerase
MNKTVQQENAALEVVRTLQSGGFLALFAGGCVRDRLMGREAKDYDVATDALPEEVEALFPKTVPIGKAFGVIAVVDGKTTVEVATFREEAGTLDGRHPETIRFSAAEEDARRRDFTINGLFFDPVADRLHDFVEGRRDLEDGVIRAIGDPTERFEEDHLRILRAVRFAHTLEFSLDPATEEAVRSMAHLITRISAERIEMELTRTLTDSPKPGKAVEHLHQLGLLEHILPELIPMIGQEQPEQFHPEGDVFEHTCLMLDLMSEHRGQETPDVKTAGYTARELAYTILLHDVGKPPTAAVGPGTDGTPRIRFDGHAAIGAGMAEAILTRLKFPNREKGHIVEAIRGHMRFMDVQKMRSSTLRKMVSSDTFGLEIELHRLDCLGSHAMLDNYDFVNRYIEEMADEPVLPEPWIRGHDLLEMGIQEGRLIGRILKEAYDAQLEQRFTGREEVLAWVRKTYPAGP